MSAVALPLLPPSACSASDEEEEEGGWQHVPRMAEGRWPGQYKSIHIDQAAEQWDEEDIQI